MATSFFLMSQKAAPAFICNNVPTWHDGTLEFFCRWGEAVLKLTWRTQWASDEDYSFGSSASHCRSSFCWLFSCITKLDNEDCHAWSVGIRPPEIRRRNRTALALDRAAPRAVRQARLRERRKYCRPRRGNHCFSVDRHGSEVSWRGRSSGDRRRRSEAW